MLVTSVSTRAHTHGEGMSAYTQNVCGEGVRCGESHTPSIAFWTGLPLIRRWLSVNTSPSISCRHW